MLMILTKQMITYFRTQTSYMNLDLQLQEFKFKTPIYQRWSDMDEAGHVNNAVYLTYLEEARVRYFHEATKWNWQEDGIILANVNMNYVRPLLYNEAAFIYARVSKIGTKSFEMQYIITVEKADSKALVAHGSSVQVMFDYKNNCSTLVPTTVREKLSTFEQNSF